MILDVRNRECFESWFVESRIVDICWGNRTGKGKTIPIDQSTQFTSFYFPIAVITGRSPFLLEYPWYRSNSALNRFSGEYSRRGAGRGRSPDTLPSRRVRSSTRLPSISIEVSCNFKTISIVFDQQPMQLVATSEMRHQASEFSSCVHPSIEPRPKRSAGIFRV